MQLNQVVGQEAVKTGLLHLWHSGKWPHALLLVAKEGRGGLPLGLALTQYIFCLNKGDDDACGQCASCQKMANLAHPDLHLSFPSISPKPGAKASSKAFLPEFRDFVKQTPYGSTFDWLQFINAENKQGNISAEECREIIDRLQLSAFEGGNKVQFIWRPEYLGKEGNILLKLIEEPPKNTYLILVAEDVEDILPTILSRTQQVMLPPLPTVAIAEALIKRQAIAESKAAQVAQLADGSYAQALQLMQYAGNDLLEPLRNWFNGIFANNGLLMNQWVEEMAKSGREQQKNFLLFVQQLLGHALRVSLIPGYTLSLPDAEASFVHKLAGRDFTPNVYKRIDKVLSDTIYHIERNAHVKTQLLSLTVQLQYLVQGKALRIDG